MGRGISTGLLSLLLSLLRVCQMVSLSLVLLDSNSVVFDVCKYDWWAKNVEMAADRTQKSGNEMYSGLRTAIINHWSAGDHGWGRTILRFDSCIAAEASASPSSSSHNILLSPMNEVPIHSKSPVPSRIEERAFDPFLAEEWGLRFHLVSVEKQDLKNQL